MKQWFADHILSSDDVDITEMLPISDKEFYASLIMVSVALAVFGILINVFGG